MGAPRTGSLCDFIHAESDRLFSRDGGVGSKVDSAQPDVLGDTHDGRVWAGSDCDSYQSPGAACDASDDAHAGTVWHLRLDSAPDRSPRGASQLVRMRAGVPDRRGDLDGG